MNLSSLLSSAPLSGNPMEWVWAERHPLLYTVIQVMHPWLACVLAFGAWQFVTGVIRRSVKR